MLRDVRNGSKWFDEEFFAPVIAVNDVKSLEEGLTLANSSRFGLTAGIFTQIEEEQREFFTRIEAGVGPPLARGLVCKASADGSIQAPQARERLDPITSPNSCGSRARRLCFALQIRRGDDVGRSCAFLIIRFLSCHRLLDH